MAVSLPGSPAAYNWWEGNKFMMPGLFGGAAPQGPAMGAPAPAMQQTMAAPAPNAAPAMGAATPNATQAPAMGGLLGADNDSRVRDAAGPAPTPGRGFSLGNMGYGTTLGTLGSLAGLAGLPGLGIGMGLLGTGIDTAKANNALSSFSDNLAAINTRGGSVTPAPQSTGFFSGALNNMTLGLLGTGTQAQKQAAEQTMFDDWMGQMMNNYDASGGWAGADYGSTDAGFDGQGGFGGGFGGSAGGGL